MYMIFKNHLESFLSFEFYFSASKVDNNKYSDLSFGGSSDVYVTFIYFYRVLWKDSFP